MSNKHKYFKNMTYEEIEAYAIGNYAQISNDFKPVNEGKYRKSPDYWFHFLMTLGNSGDSYVEKIYQHYNKILVLSVDSCTRVVNWVDVSEQKIIESMEVN